MLPECCVNVENSVHSILYSCYEMALAKWPKIVVRWDFVPREGRREWEREISTETVEGGMKGNGKGRLVERISKNLNQQNFAVVCKYTTKLTHKQSIMYKKSVRWLRLTMPSSYKRQIICRAFSKFIMNICSSLYCDYK